jgi:hypothetical protein
MYYHEHFLAHWSHVIAHYSYDNIFHVEWTLEIWSKQRLTKGIRNGGSWEGAKMDMGILCTTYELT